MKHYKPSAPAKENFARWLLTQKGRDDAIGRLASAAALDRSYPVKGTYEEVVARLSKLGADPDMHFALEDAELEWLAI